MRNGPLLAALACAVSLLGCERADPTGGDIDVLTSDDPRLGMQVADVDPASGAIRSWASAPLDAEDDEWIALPGQRQLQIHHGLGRTPNGVQVFLSFTQDGRLPALAAGDLARLVQVNDEFVTVWNDTNGNYFARVVVY